MKGFNYILVGLVLVSSLSFVLAVSDYDSHAYVTNYSMKDVVTKEPNFVVEVLKYYPYPVSTGDWFDLWISVQNMGEQNANDAVFELQPEYPFYSNDSLYRDYGLVNGRINAFKVEQTYDSTQVVLKYRVQAADNAPAGVSKLKFSAKIDGNSSLGKIYDLPIEIFSLDSSRQSVSTNGPRSLSFDLYSSVIGFVCGVFLVIIVLLIIQKVKNSKKHKSV